MHPTNPDDPFAVRLTAVATVTYTVGLMVEAPTVDMPVPHSDIRMIPQRAEVVVERNLETGELFVYRLEITGKRAKKDGTPSLLSISGQWYRRHNYEGGITYGHHQCADHPYVLNLIDRAIAVVRETLR
jgi:hypothetical protein